MNDLAPNELENVKQQLALCKLRDRVLEKIDLSLHAMKKIAQDAAEHELTLEEKKRQNEQLEEHQAVIRDLEKKYAELSYGKQK